LHRIRLKKFIPNKPLVDNYQNEKLQADEEIIIPQDDLYTISWESNFGEQLENAISDNVPNSSTRASVDTPIVLVPRERTNSNTSEQHEAATQRSPKVSPHDVNGRTTKYKRTNSGPSDVIAENTSKESGNDTELIEIIPNNAGNTGNGSTEENNGKIEKDTDNASNVGGDIIVPEISENGPNETTSPRGGRYNLRPNPNPNFSDEYRY